MEEYQRLAVSIYSKGNDWFDDESLFRNFVKSTIDFYEKNANSKIGWESIETYYTLEINRTIKFYDSLAYLFKKFYKPVIRDYYSRRFLATFVREAGFPLHFKYNNIVKEILNQSSWESIYDNAEREIIEFRKNNTEFTRLQKDILNNEEGIASLKNLLEILAAKKLNKIDNINNFNLSDNLIEKIFKNYYDIIYIPSVGYISKRKISQKKVSLPRVSPGKVAHREVVIKPFEYHFFLIVEEDEFKDFGIKTNLSKTPVKLPFNLPQNSIKLETIPSFKENFNDLCWKIDNDLISITDSKPLFIPFDFGSFCKNLREDGEFSINIKYQTIESAETYNLANDTLNFEFMLFDELGNTINETEINIMTDEYIYIMPFTTNFYQILEKEDKIKKISKFLYKISNNNEGFYSLKDCFSIYFSIIDLDISFPESNTYISKITNSRVFSNNFDKKIEIETTDYEDCTYRLENIISGKVIENFLTDNIDIPSEIGTYSLKVFENNNLVARRKFYIIPDIGIQSNENEIRIIDCYDLKGWNIEVTSNEIIKKQDYLYEPLEKKNIKAILKFTKDNNCFEFNIILNCEREIIVCRNTKDIIENNQNIFHKDISESSIIKFRRSKMQFGNYYYIEVESKRDGFNFPNIRTFKINSTIEDLKSLIPNKFINYSLNIYYIDNDLKQLKYSFEVKKNNYIELEKVNNIVKVKNQISLYDDLIYKYRIFNILSPWDEPEEIKVDSSFELDISNLSSSLWMIYLLEDQNIISEKMFISKLNKDKYTEVQNAFLNLKPYINDQYIESGDILEKNGYFKDKSELLIEAFNNIYYQAIQNDFLLFSNFPQKYTKLPAWWVFVREDNKKYKLENDFFEKNTRFYWELLTIDDISWIYNEFYINKKDEFIKILLDQDEHKFLKNLDVLKLIYLSIDPDKLQVHYESIIEKMEVFNLDRHNIGEDNIEKEVNIIKYQKCIDYKVRAKRLDKILSIYPRKELKNIIHEIIHTNNYSNILFNYKRIENNLIENIYRILTKNYNDLKYKPQWVEKGIVLIEKGKIIGIIINYLGKIYKEGFIDNSKIWKLSKPFSEILKTEYKNICDRMKISDFDNISEILCSLITFDIVNNQLSRKRITNQMFIGDELIHLIVNILKTHSKEHFNSWYKQWVTKILIFNKQKRRKIE